MAGKTGFEILPPNSLDISEFKPRGPEPAALGEERAADRAAERAGFHTREPVERVKRVRKSAEPLDHAYVRGPVSVINRFKTYCNDTGLSYGEALDELMRKSGI